MSVDTIEDEAKIEMQNITLFLWPTARFKVMGQLFMAVKSNKHMQSFFMF